MTRPKDIGTIGETAVVRVLRPNGFPQAERRALAGAYDLGDITGTPGLVWEVKWGKAAETASAGQIDKWLDETETERENADADFGILVVKAKGVGADRAGQSWAYLSAHDLAELLDPAGDVLYEAPDFAIRMTLADAVRALRWAGYGEPLDELDEDVAA